MIITFLNHLVSPSISPEVMDQTLNEGDNAVFTCDVTGEPVPTIRWYFDDVLLEGDTSKHIIATYELQIMNVQSSDVGTYTCNATNVVSSNTSSGVLSVRGKSIYIHCLNIWLALHYVHNIFSLLSVLIGNYS